MLSPACQNSDVEYNSRMDDVPQCIEKGIIYSVGVTLRLEYNEWSFKQWGVRQW